MIAAYRREAHRRSHLGKGERSENYRRTSFDIDRRRSLSSLDFCSFVHTNPSRPISRSSENVGGTGKMGKERLR
ncbi:MAG: hypothetical protein ABS79_03295 [Planctomycetes bacterium SCN 63-9]|nr:MAG: hypothetical protein ABS79_03295 [Planctomycetes bacterium SCN 63-9]